MTTHDAQQIGIDAAQETYRQWDRQEDAAEVVFRHLSRLDTALTAAGLDAETHDDLWSAAGIAFRDEAEALFGHDYVVSGQ